MVLGGLTTAPQTLHDELKSSRCDVFTGVI